MTDIKGDHHFQGFSPQTFQFLNDLKVNNTKIWFEAHRNVYEDVLLTPFQNLVKDLIPCMLDIDPALEVLPIRKCISRIHRDIRFSKDKSPYRANMWLSFKRPTDDWKQDPVYFFELMPDSYRYGMGFSRMDKITMNTMRKIVEEHPERIVKINSLLAPHSKFELMGDEYKRPVGMVQNLSPELAKWYQKKDIFIMSTYPIDSLVVQPALLDKIMHDFLILQEVYIFFWDLKRVKNETEME